MKLRALVTGGTRGIGLAIAKTLHRDGVEVWVASRKKSSDFSWIETDLASRDSVNNLCSYLMNHPIDILINNAGINTISSFIKITDTDFDQILETNLRAPMALCRAVLPGMVKNNFGRIVNISSIYSEISKELRAPYSASKFGLVGLTKAISAEYAAQRILANCVAPGIVKTDLTEAVLGPEGMQRMAESIPIKRLAEPEEIAELVAWIASKKNTYITGQNFVIDGGLISV